MKIFKRICLLGAAALLLASAPMSRADVVKAEGATYSAKEFVPDKADFVDYWGGVGNINPEDGDGITTFAHAAMTVPLCGEKIEMETGFMLLSKRTEEEGGDNVDGWVTYSFSAEPGGSADNTFPSYTGRVNGYFLHCTNYSSSSAPNCVEVQVVQCLDGGQTSMVTKFFVDNLVTKAGTNALHFKLTLTKEADYDWTLEFTSVSDGSVLKKVENLELDDDLFINEHGQTYFSTAIYEGKGCDGEHWNHRGLNIYSVQAYTIDAADAEISLSEIRYVYEEGMIYRPEVTVSVAGRKLEKDVDCYFEYSGNTSIGTGKVIVYFINDYAGNVPAERMFEILSEDSEGDTSDSGQASVGNESDGDSSSGCGSSVGVSAVAGALLSGAVALTGKKRGRRL